ncbi:hypothetical protein F5B21DRAFT_503533 [Xylaria acuta]|nr:hypothetical protein F5B21DRAFT_503533 [Xylaria acuta]
MSTPKKEVPTTGSDPYIQDFSVRGIDDVKLMNVLRAAFGPTGFEVSVKWDRFYIKAPRKLTEDEIGQCRP